MRQIKNLEVDRNHKCKLLLVSYYRFLIRTFLMSDKHIEIWTFIFARKCQTHECPQMLARIKQAKVKQCSTSHSGGNLVADLSPVPSTFPTCKKCQNVSGISFTDEGFEEFKCQAWIFGCAFWEFREACKCLHFAASTCFCFVIVAGSSLSFFYVL